MLIPHRPFALTLLLFATGVLPATQVAAGPRAAFPPQDEAIIHQKWPEAIETPSGLRYVVLQEGHGDRPLSHQLVKALYRGTLLDGTEFSAMLDPEHPFEFRLGTQAVIEGWEEAFSDMRPGEKRILIVPYALGYGLRGREPDIPNRATLIFEVTLLAVE